MRRLARLFAVVSGILYVGMNVLAVMCFFTETNLSDLGGLAIAGTGSVIFFLLAKEFGRAARGSVE